MSILPGLISLGAMVLILAVAAIGLAGVTFDAGDE